MEEFEIVKYQYENFIVMQHKSVVMLMVSTKLNE